MKPQVEGFVAFRYLPRALLKARMVVRRMQNPVPCGAGRVEMRTFCTSADDPDDQTGRLNTMGLDFGPRWKLQSCIADRKDGEQEPPRFL